MTSIEDFKYSNWGLQILQLKISNTSIEDNFFDPKFTGFNYFLDSKILWNQNFVDEKFLWTHIFFDPKLFSIQKIVGPKINWSKKFLGKEFWVEKILTKKNSRIILLNSYINEMKNKIDSDTI